MRQRTRLLLTFYGDDFTGSTDVLEALARAGIRTALFLDAPRSEQLSGRFADLEAVGVAGMGRSMTPGQMDSALPPVFERIGRLGANLFHYKTCSTFDSSPEVGSIGRAIDIGQRTFASPFVPLVVGAPVLRRYCLFGNLFATVGDETFRLDRHPTMRCHPVTPMGEADLRVHLARQTSKTTALMDILHLTGTPAEVDRRFEALLASRPDLVLFDVLDEPRLEEVGRLIWTRAVGDGQVFAVGSSGLEYALTAHWRSSFGRTGPQPFESPGPVDAIAVVSGSCSPATRDQIRWAREHGFAIIEIASSSLVDPERADEERGEVVRGAMAALERGQSVVICTAVAPDDPRIAETLDLGNERGLPPHATRERIGDQLGRVLRELLDTTSIRRVVVAGGDTSGHVVRQVGIEVLEVLLPLTPGSPLCRATSRRSSVDGLEIVLKGGQIGRPNFFETVLRGEA
jgi:uncharacterized protein YgbK (DUF1537 family)